MKEHPPSDPYRTAPPCDHGLAFDAAVADAKALTPREVKQLYPRLDGACPKGCGYVGIAYVSMAHYVYGDW